MKELVFSVTKDDFDIQTFRSGGKGGQHQNTTDSGVKIIHRDSGAVGESREQRSQLQNKRAAFKRLVNSTKFQAWLKLEFSKRVGLLNDIEEVVNRELKNVKIEVKKEGKWTIVKEDELT